MSSVSVATAKCPLRVLKGFLFRRKAAVHCFVGRMELRHGSDGHNEEVRSVLVLC